MSFLSIFRKSNSVSVIQLNGVISPNMGRRKGLNLQELGRKIKEQRHERPNSDLLLTYKLLCLEEVRSNALN